MIAQLTISIHATENEETVYDEIYPITFVHGHHEEVTKVPPLIHNNATNSPRLENVINSPITLSLFDNPLRQGLQPFYVITNFLIDEVLKTSIPKSNFKTKFF